ncbi:hypothetical protein chiPu_0020409 [Chiloscyllium punctatum]|uniref:Uncharacterized protein n=1 Tax=Chiloscyllium punctatum TaxID=137246 RepID=A0A401RFB8_CHIPU|nr:hypothetical protein [Chiloscyllium punctatum]
MLHPTRSKAPPLLFPALVEESQCACSAPTKLGNPAPPLPRQVSKRVSAHVPSPSRPGSPRPSFSITAVDVNHCACSAKTEQARPSTHGERRRDSVRILGRGHRNPALSLDTGGGRRDSASPSNHVHGGGVSQCACHAPPFTPRQPKGANAHAPPETSQACPSL